MTFHVRFFFHRPIASSLIALSLAGLSMSCGNTPSSSTGEGGAAGVIGNGGTDSTGGTSTGGTSSGGSTTGGASSGGSSTGGASTGGTSTGGTSTGGTSTGGTSTGGTSTGGTSSGGTSTGGASTGGTTGTGGTTSTSDDVGRYTVFELDVPFSQAGVSNVWEGVTVTAVFTSPTGKTITVKGFYHSTDLWKVRFAPWELGSYGYHVTVAKGSTQSTLDGSFDCVASNEKGFIRASKTNPFRLIYETDGSLYNALGMGNCFDDPNAANWGLDGGDTSKGQSGNWADGNTYLSAMGGQGKLNIFRWSVNNCAPDMWQTIAPSGNTYLAKEAIWGDELVQMLRQHGFRVYMDFFGWKPAYSGQWQDKPSMDAVRRYVDYIVARYGAYVDFWEVCNESSPPTEWISLVAGYVESIDPYGHMVSSSWEHPELAEIGIASPHWYEREAELDSDTRTVTKIDAVRYGNKPIVFGEQGNSVQNWDPTSSLRARIRSWTAFFDEGYFIFWDQQGTKNYMSGAANLYIGSELRGYFAVLQDFTAAVPSDVTKASVSSSPSGSVRTYALKSSKGFYVYLRDAQSYTNTRSGVSLSLNLANAGTATFIETQTGKVLKTTSVSAGSSSLAVPDFVTDVALAIAY